MLDIHRPDICLTSWILGFYFDNLQEQKNPQKPKNTKQFRPCGKHTSTRDKEKQTKTYSR